jgi:hypothetical protein
MTARPHCLAARPEFGRLFEGVHIRREPAAIGGNEAMAADPLSDLLKTVRLTGAVFFEIAAEEPWAVESPPRELILPKILPGADHLIAYHVVTTGRCFATAVGGQAMLLEAGQVVVFTNGQPHIMSSGPNMPADPPAGRARSRRLRPEAFLHQLRQRGGFGQAGLRISRLRRPAL